MLGLPDNHTKLTFHRMVPGYMVRLLFFMNVYLAVADLEKYTREPLHIRILMSTPS